MQAFLISMHFYQRNMEAMYAETEYLLKEVLNEELHRKQQELNLFYISKVTIDTIPLTIRVTTSKGVKTFTVDAKKSKKNISQSMAERSWHSVACMKSSLSTDTLHLLWNNKLKERKILAKTDVHLSINHLDNSISYFKCRICISYPFNIPSIFLRFSSYSSPFAEKSFIRFSYSFCFASNLF